MNAQKVFDCDDIKGLILSYCLPEFQIITRNMMQMTISIESEKTHGIIIGGINHNADKNGVTNPLLLNCLLVAVLKT